MTQRRRGLAAGRRKITDQLGVGAAHPSWLKRYVELKTDAATMRSFEGELIPGLLQTQEYARRVHLVAGDLIKPADLDRLVAARMRRQSRLTDDTPLELSTVVSEAAFRRALADSEIGPAQLAHLTEMAQRPNVTLHVLPYAAGLHPSMAGSFAVLTFDPGVAPPFGYQEHAIGGHVVADRNAVSQLMEPIQATGLAPWGTAGFALTSAEPHALNAKASVSRATPPTRRCEEDTALLW